MQISSKAKATQEGDVSVAPQIRIQSVLFNTICKLFHSIEISKWSTNEPARCLQTAFIAQKMESIASCDIFRSHRCEKLTEMMHYQLSYAWKISYRFSSFLTIGGFMLWIVGNTHQFSNKSHISKIESSTGPYQIRLIPHRINFHSPIHLNYSLH